VRLPPPWFFGANSSADWTYARIKLGLCQGLNAKVGRLVDWSFLRPTSIVGGWWKYMCKVFLEGIASVDRGFGVLGGGWGLDKVLGGDCVAETPISKCERAGSAFAQANAGTPYFAVASALCSVHQ